MMKKVRVNFKHENINPGDVINLEFSGEVPADPFWRRRWKDKDLDNCMELVVEQVKSKKKGAE